MPVSHNTDCAVKYSNYNAGYASGATAPSSNHRGLAVPTNAATPLIMAHYGRYKANNNFLASLYDIKTRIEVIYNF